MNIMIGVSSDQTYLYIPLIIGTFNFIEEFVSRT